MTGFDLTGPVAALWRDHGETAVLTALAATALAVLIALIRAIRYGQTDRWIAAVTGFAVLGLSAEGMWVVATERINLPVVIALGVFFVAEAMMVNSSRAARRFMAEHNHPGKHGRAVWVIAVVAGVIVAMNAQSTVEFLLRLALPVGWAYLWWNTLTAAGSVKPERSSWRWTPQRLLIWVGALEPGERGLAEVDRERRIAAMTLAAHRLHSGGRLRRYQAARLRRLGLAADDAAVDEVQRRVARVHRIVELTRPAATDAATDADKQADTTAATGPVMATDIRRPSPRTSARTAKASDTATRVAKLLARTPDTDAATIAVRLAVSERTVRRHLAAMATATGTASVNGHNFTEGRVS